MTVYVVMHGNHYESTDVVSVHATLEGAVAFAEAYVEKWTTGLKREADSEYHCAAWCGDTSDLTIDRHEVDP